MIAPRILSSWFLASVALIALIGCGTEDGPVFAPGDVADEASQGDGSSDVGTIDIGFPDEDTEEDSRFDDVDEDADDAGPSGCNDSDDCPIGEVCVDLLPGPDNGFCTTRCQDDDQCEEGMDCVVVGDDELSFSACIEVDFCLDEDEDGYGIGPGCLGIDCNDGVATINAGAPEACNGTDDNCNGQIDDNTVEEREDCETGFAGVCGEGRYRCISGLVECVARFESSPEICDDKDNDCDGDVDEEASDATEWYRDADGDFVGVDTDVRLACDQPTGYVGVDGDCDDTVRAVNPGAAEVCDGVDNDCRDGIDGPTASDSETVYADNDNDGFGDPRNARDGCPGDGWVTNSLDCDDETFNPPGSAGALPWYHDFDEDGFGDPDDFVYSCLPVDGYVENDGDCDDTLSAVNPDAPEVCDGEDNNCNDEVDEGVRSTFYRDFDADGRGDPDTTTLACEGTAGWVANPDDCNDREPEAWSGRPEICDEIDNNCNDRPDEGVTTTYYRDWDRDTRGDPSFPRPACAQPDGWVANDGDCNDFEPEAWTGRPEICDEIDNNCIAGTDEGVATTYYLDADGDGYGNPTVTLEACEQPDRYVANNGDCNDGEPEAWTGRLEICDDIDNNCSGQADEGVQRIYWLDFDGDGYGRPGEQVSDCSLPEGYALNDGDCDDTESTISPREEEFCQPDGVSDVDENCDPSDDC